MDSLNNLANSLLGLGNDLTTNVATVTLVTIFLAMYGPRLSPKLPSQVRQLFNMPLFRGAVIFLILFLANRNLRLSLLITIVFLATMNQVQYLNTMENFSHHQGESGNHDSAYHHSKDYPPSYNMNPNEQMM
jgi:hypothetical protein